MTRHTYALDYETYYDKDYGLKNMSPQTYVRDSRFDPYMVSVVGSDGYRFVGNPSNVQWERLANNTVVSHNAAFDMQVWLRQVELEQIPYIPPKDWHCTADMSAYFQIPRALDGACWEALGVQVDKSVRDDMKGVRFNSLPPDAKERWETYALRDSERCLDLWEEFGPDWPDREKRLSSITRDAGICGVAVNEEMLEEALGHVMLEAFEAEQLIPWVSEGKKVLSPKAVSVECSKLGIPPPRSMAQNTEVFENWLTKYESVAPWAKAMGIYRQANRLLKVLEEVHARTQSGIMSFDLKYFGAAATGRWSGGSGLNMQNLTKKPRFGVNLRHIFIPRPGKKFVIVDLSQIEPRCLAYLAGNVKFLELVASGIDCYEAAARSTGRYTDPRPMKMVDNDLRNFYKGRVLGAGYGISGAAYKSAAKALAGLDLDLRTAKAEIKAFRKENPEIVRRWAEWDGALARSARSGADLNMELPSGRVITYFSCDRDAKGFRAAVCSDGSNTRRWWGSKLIENETQGMARDVFGHGILDVVDKGIDVVFHVHDELICEVDESDADEALLEVIESLSKTPDWAEGLPVAAEGGVFDRYTK